MKYIKILGLLAGLALMGGCASNGGTAVTIYDKDGNKVQETSADATQMGNAYQLAIECNKAKIAIAERNNLGILQPTALQGLSGSAQTEYMRNLPMIYMATALQSATARTDDGCSQAIVAYYNHKNVNKQANTQLWSKGLGIAGFLGGAYLIGNTVEGILNSAIGAGGSTTQISGSRVNMDSGNNYNSAGARANSSSSGDGLGSSNVFPRGNTDTSIYGGNQPRATTTNLNDQNGSVDFGSNSGDNAPQGILEPIEVIPPVE